LNNSGSFARSGEAAVGRPADSLNVNHSLSSPGPGTAGPDWWAQPLFPEEGSHCSVAPAYTLAKSGPRGLPKHYLLLSSLGVPQTVDNQFSSMESCSLLKIALSPTPWIDEWP
jgi:hypothetical protein